MWATVWSTPTSLSGDSSPQVHTVVLIPSGLGVRGFCNTGEYWLLYPTLASTGCSTLTRLGAQSPYRRVDPSRLRCPGILRRGGGLVDLPLLLGPGFLRLQAVPGDMVENSKVVISGSVLPGDPLSPCRLVRRRELPVEGTHHRFTHTNTRARAHTHTHEHTQSTSWRWSSPKWCRLIGWRCKSSSSNSIP